MSLPLNYKVTYDFFNKQLDKKSYNRYNTITHFQGNGKMNKISKILYGFLSFTLAMTYKIEDAVAVIKVKLTASSAATESKCSTYGNLVTNLNDARGEYASEAKNIGYQETLCEENKYLSACSGKVYSESMLSTLGSICSATNATCTACPNSGKVSKSYRKKILTSAITICSAYTFTESWGINTNNNNNPTLQTYSLYIADPADLVEIHPKTDCYLPNGTAGLTDTTGTYTTKADCPYLTK